MTAKLRQTALPVVLTAVFAALIAVSTLITVPLPGGVPVTLQTFAVALTGYCLGVRRSVPAVAVYLLLGAAGVPVFAGFSAGPAVLAGKTGGFLFGFLLLALLCSLGGGLRNRAFAVLCGLAGLALCHLAGVLWFARLTGTGFASAAMAVSVPFLLKDALSVAAAMALSLRLKPVLGRIK